MTYEQAVARLLTRVELDLSAEVSLIDPAAIDEAFNTAMKEVARETYCLWSWHSALTLALNEPEYDLVDGVCCPDLVFDPYGVYVNGAWLQMQEAPDFLRERPGYFSESSSAKPGVWVHMPDAQLRIAAPPNAAAVAAENYVIGFKEPPVFRYDGGEGENSKAAELPGPSVMHLMYVDKAALNVTVSYGFDKEGLTARANIEKSYEARREAFARRNLARAKPLKKQASAGLVRRVYGLGDPL